MPTSCSASRAKRTLQSKRAWTNRSQFHEYMPTDETGWFPGKLGPSRPQLRGLSSEGKFENSGSHQSKRYDSSFSMNFSSTYLWKSVPDATGGYDNRRILGFIKKHHNVCTPALRTKRSYAIPRALATVACGLGFVINFFAKPSDALASRARSLCTPRAGKAMHWAKCQTRSQNEIEFSLEYFNDETLGFYSIDRVEDLTFMRRLVN